MRRETNATRLATELVLRVNLQISAFLRCMVQSPHTLCGLGLVCRPSGDYPNFGVLSGRPVIRPQLQEYFPKGKFSVEE
jgi:hypothetical protein